ncbi:hypothetical protein L2E82_21545 [Cichorium intybus]|uniref:Uncharacterized protein n=1 Tax=Cichorium intybus TaxID=13427 RepID=A0ACB9DW97_CICIN|nr:hypothetical protein L2E82_21545 [Cichorium intybus]
MSNRIHLRKHKPILGILQSTELPSTNNYKKGHQDKKNRCESNDKRKKGWSVKKQGNGVKKENIEWCAISEFIKTDAYKLEITQRPPMAVTNAVSWRNEGIYYKKNEVFLDVIESVNILVNSNRQVLRSEVVGALKMRTCLRNATNVQIEIPVPSDATKPIVRTSMGSASYAPEQESLIWRIRTFPGDKEYMLGAEYKLPSVAYEDGTPDKKAPIRVKFEIPYFTVSGIQVRHLKVIEKSAYQTLPWVRYITMAGEYEIRI